MLFASDFFAMYFASLIPTIVYKIIEFLLFKHSSIILSICCYVLTKTKSFLLYSKLENCDFNDKKIRSNVSPVESDIRYTLYFSFISLLVKLV